MILLKILLTLEMTSESWIEDLFTSPWFTGIGTLASLIGIIITILQVWKSRKTSEQIKQDVESNTEAIRLFLDIAGLTKMNDEVDLARENIRSCSYDAACVRLAELKRFLWEYKNKVTGDNVKTISEVITLLGTDIIILAESKRGAGVDKTELLQHLNKIGDLLSEWSGKLKNENI